MLVSCLACVSTSFVLTPCWWRHSAVTRLVFKCGVVGRSLGQGTTCQMISWYDYLFALQIADSYLDSFLYDLLIIP
jgi:hypothetical protein